jgi:hypothetical protein
LNIYIYEQYNPETARRNTLKLKYSISIKKIKHLPKQNLQPSFKATMSNELNCRMGKDELTWSGVLDDEDEVRGD